MGFNILDRGDKLILEIADTAYNDELLKTPSSKLDYLLFDNEVQVG